MNRMRAQVYYQSRQRANAGRMAIPAHPLTDLQPLLFVPPETGKVALTFDVWSKFLGMRHISDNLVP